MSNNNRCIMGEIIKNRIPLAKKQFLMRQLYTKHITEAEYEERVAPLEQEIMVNQRDYMNKEMTKLMEQMSLEKKTTFGDGDLKRKMARLLIEFLKEDFTSKELKGIFRQGYKIMRQETGEDDD